MDSDEAELDPKPFVSLLSPRDIDHPDLPDDLADFYRCNEGTGLETTPFRLIRLCTLTEVERIGWTDLHIIGDEPLDGWEHFSAYRIGISSFFDEIVYVLSAPSCQRGNIFTTGFDICGPGGDGPFAYEPSLVLAATFQEWLTLLERFNWKDFGLCPGDLDDLPKSDQLEMRRYFKTLNPNIAWDG